MIGKIIKNVSNTYIVVSEDGRKYECTARGKLKIEELKPVVGDNVEIEKIDETTAVIKSVLERSSFLKRPRVSNITQIMFVISSSMPKPNIPLLDKELVFSEFLKIKPIIVINKIDLDKKEADKICEIYENVRIQSYKNKCNRKCRNK